MISLASPWSRLVTRGRVLQPVLFGGLFAVLTVLRLNVEALSGSRASCLVVPAPTAGLTYLAESAALLRTDPACGNSLALTWAGVAAIVGFLCLSIGLARLAVQLLFGLPRVQLAVQRLTRRVLAWCCALLGRLAPAAPVVRTRDRNISAPPMARWLSVVLCPAGRRAPPLAA